MLLCGLLSVLCMLALGGLAQDASAAKITVRTQSGFHLAVKKLRTNGGVIILQAGRYGNLSVGPRSPRWLTVRARPGVTVNHLGLNRTRAVRIVGVRVKPGSRGSLLNVVSSRNVKLDRVRVTAAGSSLFSRMVVAGSHHVTISRSEFTRCGENREACLSTGWGAWRSSYVRILATRFHDCYGCDFIRGHIGRSLTIRGSTFDRAVPGPCGTAWECNHQDAVQISAGNGILIERNRFGLTAVGAGQLYISGHVSRLTIRNNVFFGTDAAFPDWIGWAAIVLGHHRDDEPHVPLRAVVVNNTILTGSPRPDGWTNSVFATPSYANVPQEERPVLANNVLGVVGTPERLCPLLNVSSRNVMREGTACSETDAVADPALEEDGYPLEHAPGIDQADPSWATPQDIRGVPRDEAPDIGAFEFVRPPSSTGAG